MRYLAYSAKGSYKAMRRTGISLMTANSLNSAWNPAIKSRSLRKRRKVHHGSLNSVSPTTGTSSSSLQFTQ